MNNLTSTGDRSMGKKKCSGTPMATVHSLGHDIFCIVFSFLDLFDLVHCSAVCKFWNQIVNRSNLFQVLCQKQNFDFLCSKTANATSSGKSWKEYLEQLAMEHHRSSLEEGHVVLDRWKVHPAGIDQCRTKMGKILTGGGDKVVRLWSVESYKCLEEYSVPEILPLIDFDFDESKVVGLVGTRICIWRRNGYRSIFPSGKGGFQRGLCMRYMDPEAVVGCEDGTARVFDMYSKTCSRIIRTYGGSITSLALGDNELIVSGSSLGNITLSSPSSDHWLATLKSINSAGVRTLCYNPCSHLLFAGSTSGYATCFDLRKMKQLWERKVSPNVLYSMQHLRNDRRTLVVGGIDGVLRILDQNTGAVLSSYITEGNTSTNFSRASQGYIERKKGRRLLKDTQIDRIPISFRPPITCLALGMKKVVTTHGSTCIRVWKFNN